MSRSTSHFETASRVKPVLSNWDEASCTRGKRKRKDDTSQGIPSDAQADLSLRLVQMPHC